MVYICLLFIVASGVAISSYAKYCYRKLTKAALTGAKKVSSLCVFMLSFLLRSKLTFLKVFSGHFYVSLLSTNCVTTGLFVPSEDVLETPQKYSVYRKYLPPLEVFTFNFLPKLINGRFILAFSTLHITRKILSCQSEMKSCISIHPH